MALFHLCVADVGPVADFDCPGIGGRFSQYGSGVIIDDEYQVGSVSRNVAVDAALTPNIGFTVAVNNAGGGSITLTFNVGLQKLGFSWVHLDAETYIITFTNTLLASSASLNFDLFIDSTSDFYNPTVEFGEASADQIDPISISQLIFLSLITAVINGNPAYFNQVAFSCSGSGSISQINFTVPGIHIPVWIDTAQPCRYQILATAAVPLVIANFRLHARWQRQQLFRMSPDTNYNNYIFFNRI